ncbi:HS12A-like protein [Mya arenaria]|uniref:HS12A-like protein n=1 Tax=Mya arenaria TaxID=6604 RepID=A0ABY7FB73_MYAAR|nr:HS12A-like protein [Mya arenaria]
MFSQNTEKAQGIEIVFTTRKQDAVLLKKNDVVKVFFDSSVDVIIANLKEILSACHEDIITSLLLVGGYSESPYVIERIQRDFCQLHTVIVKNGRLAVMKGAVMMGLKSREGQDSHTEGEHREQFKYNFNGKTWCIGVFDKVRGKGQLLQHKQEFSRNFCNVFKRPDRKQQVQLRN